MKKHVKNEAAEQILQHVKTHGPTSRADICIALGVESKDMAHALGILTDHGRIIRCCNTGKYHLPVNVFVSDWLARPWRKIA